MTHSKEGLLPQIAAILRDDPACGGRVTGASIEAIAGLFSHSRGGEELREAAQSALDVWDQVRPQVHLLDTPIGADCVFDALRALLASPPPVDRADAIPAGMKPWHGGDSAPEDWDGGPVLFRNRKLSVQSPDWRWKWKEPPYSYDIIAYTPKPAAQPLEGLTSGENAPEAITYNPVYGVTYVGADPTRGHVYLLAASPANHAGSVGETEA